MFKRLRKRFRKVQVQPFKDLKKASEIDASFLQFGCDNLPEPTMERMCRLIDLFNSEVSATSIEGYIATDQGLFELGNPVICEKKITKSVCSIKYTFKSFYTYGKGQINNLIVTQCNKMVANSALGLSVQDGDKTKLKHTEKVG